ncbi:uromodulin-like [Hyperolius riggenbachi]|uniref:uromodulin-like n=1 Tax=Hyperolius riggenbachi TaxID=752182 RepID=UPI0035A32B86
MKIFLVLLVALCAFISDSEECGNEICASDEICDNSACQCNSSSYTINPGSNPAPVLDCSGGYFDIYIAKCWLEKNGYNSSNIRLQSPTCPAAREIVNDTAQMALHRPLRNNDCNNTITINASHVTFIYKLYIFGKEIPVQTRNNIIMNVSCTYPLSMSVQLNVLLPVLGTTTINVPGTNINLTLSMVVYKDSAFSSLLSEDDLLFLGDTIYISVVVPALDVTHYKLLVTTIYATGQGTNTTNYDLLVNGCPASGLADGLITVISNGNYSESRFAMKTFQISGSESVILYAVVLICTESCIPDCSSQRKLPKTQGKPATVSLSLGASSSFDTNSANKHAFLCGEALSLWKLNS